MPVYRAVAPDAESPRRAAGVVIACRVIPLDPSDEQWAVLEPRAREVMQGLTVAVGRPMVHDLRAMCDAVVYVVRNGIEWRALLVHLRRWRRCMRSGSGGTAAACRWR